ncbi:uncharacterized protein LOC110818661 isoform X2 [Carica papaya]|uniref:uncharacterized protein LOC110818661 isoform X2 n=1 Tax=Carica papaya TaxID=3649 RepID=UPI000B8CD20E|nr:uncharacterized protein LOC110818661 isoform X2 [Carica papaya]
MDEEEEILMEVEAVRAVYGEDCKVIDSYPPHLQLHIKPRTADISSQQFVEAVITIRAGSEEAVERLSIMNHPDGDCPLCLCPLVPEDDKSKCLPFMKLMSCFHCFHSECIIRWWHWLQDQKETSAKDLPRATERPIRHIKSHEDITGPMEESMGNCPVCRKVFHTKDLDHVHDLVGAYSSQLIQDSDETNTNENEKLLHSEAENIRRERFETILKLQEENSGLIEPRKNIVVLPGMFLPQPIRSTPTPTSTSEVTEQDERQPVGAAPGEPNLSGLSTRPGTSQNQNSYMNRRRVRNPRKPVRQWIRKDDNTAD